MCEHCDGRALLLAVTRAASHADGGWPVADGGWPVVVCLSTAPGFGPAYRGSAFSQTLQFQAASWSGSPPIDWETKALLYQDATSLTLPPSLTDAYGFNRLANMYTFARANNSGGTVTVNENVLELVSKRQLRIRIPFLGVCPAFLIEL